MYESRTVQIIDSISTLENGTCALFQFIVHRRPASRAWLRAWLGAAGSLAPVAGRWTRPWTRGTADGGRSSAGAQENAH